MLLYMQFNTLKLKVWKKKTRLKYWRVCRKTKIIKGLNAYWSFENIGVCEKKSNLKTLYTYC